jgi:ribosomal protein S27E
MSSDETSLPESPGECVDCGKKATVNVDPYGMPSEDVRCRDCYELLCSRTYREATHARM